jgi:hypothetical protein
MIEAAIATLLLEDSEFQDIAGKRVYMEHAEQDAAKPYVLLERIGTDRQYSNNGPTGTPSGRIQAVIVGTSYSETKKLADVVRTTLDGRQQITVMDKENHEHEIEAIFLEDERDNSGDPEDGQASSVARQVQQDYDVHFTE